VVVIDPNGQTPIVVTGSHNSSVNASTKNDGNLVIIRGNRALAQAYAVNLQSVYDHYEFRAVAKLMEQESKNVATAMENPTGWKAGWSHGDKKQELEWWLG
jgi:phosphatidylserine/phosphatidylglycerophosphate/cardiolipin synthase-like enzyme